MRVTPTRSSPAESWLAKAYCVYMGERLRRPIQRTAHSFCHSSYEEPAREAGSLHVDLPAGSRFLDLEYYHRRQYILANQGSVTHSALTHVRTFSRASSIVPTVTPQLSIGRV